MNCPIQNNNSEILLDFCSRRLSFESTLLVEEHIENCQECKAMTASQKAVWDALDQWEAEPVSADFDRRLYQRIEKRGDGPWAWLAGLASGLQFRPALTVGAACATVLFAAMLSRGPLLNISQQADSKDRVEVTDIEQAEQALEDMDMLNKLGVVAMASDVKQESKTI